MYLVTTSYRGVFYGDIDGDITQKTLTLNNCRNVIYWAKNPQGLGFLGLAAVGPAKGSRIGAKADNVLLHDVTSVTPCTAEAIAALSNFDPSD